MYPTLGTGSAPPHPSTEWELLHDRYYRKHELYPLDWGIDLSDYTVSVAPNGGPIALMLDDRKSRAVRRAHFKGPGSSQSILIYSSSGQPITELPWAGGRLAGLGWSDDERVICVAADGHVHLLDLNRQSSQFSLGADASDKGIIDVRIWPTGLVALLANFSLIALTSFSQPRPFPLAFPGIQDPPHDWQVIPPSASLSRQPEVHMAVDSTIIVVDAQSCEDQFLKLGTCTRLSVSPNGKLISLYTTQDKVWVVSADYRKSLSECAISPSPSSSPSPSPSPSSSRPQLVWCGTDSVLLFRDNILWMIGPFGDTIQYPFQGKVVISSEIDGVRIFSQDTCEFLHKVPMAAEEVFRIGSTSPAAMLYDALEYFDNGNPKAEEHIRAIRVDLPEAVDRCLEAAAHEWSPHYQKVLLRAASLGKSFLDTYSADGMVNMGRTLRVLNAVRSPEVGITLTYTQLQEIQPQGLIKHLTGRHLHLLALRICNFLHLPTDDVLVDWACAKIRSAKGPEEILCRQIVEKLSHNPGLSYAPIANTALALGQRRLASRLLEHEPRVADQVPLLLGMDENDIALERAIESADADLLFHTLFHLKRKLSLAEFLRSIGGKDIACNLLIHYASHQDRHLLKDYYYQADNRPEMARLLLREALEETTVAERVSKMQLAIKQYGKLSPTESKSVEEEVRLLKMQESLQSDLGGHFVGLSIIDTLYKCYFMGQGSKASKVISEFKIPERRHWWTALRAHVAARDWDALAKLASAKKNPIGCEAFVNECLAAQHTSEAKKYIVKCDPKTRSQLYMRVGAFKEAADSAYAQRDALALKNVQDQAQSHPPVDARLHQEINVMLAQLQK